MSGLTHLQRLEAESIHIMREVAAEAENPVMMYSIGKDSSVMLRLAMKAFAPGKPPFPMLHVNTGWKFKNMIEFRDQQMKELGLNLHRPTPTWKRRRRASTRSTTARPTPTS
jgi:sulfate adenylyltransferase subunit 2